MIHQIAFLLLGAWLVPALASAQTSFGIQSGVLISDLNFYEVDGDLQSLDLSTKSKVGWAFGVVADIPLSSKLGLRSDVTYRRKGYREDVTPPFQSETEYLVWTLDYVDLAILFRFRPKVNDAFHLVAGPSVSYLCGMRTRETGDVQDFDPAYPTSWQQSPVGIVDPAWLGLSLFDVGLNAGFGYGFDTGTSSLVFEFRFQQGLMNVHNGFVLRDENGAPIGTMNSRNQVFMLNVSWLLPIGHEGAAEPR